MSENERQWAIEGFIAGIDELKAVLGPEAVGPVECAKEELLKALAHRDGGRQAEALEHVGRAMSKLSSLGQLLGAAEAELMRGLTGSFVAGLGRGDGDSVETDLEQFQSRAGLPKGSGDPEL